jgi:hypothetical protein
MVPLAIVLGAALLVGCSSPADPASEPAVADTDDPVHSSDPTATPGASTAHSTAPGQTLAAGRWGGEGAVLRIADDGAATLEFDCATGSLSDPPTIQPDGSFSWVGEFDPERGNPVAGTGDADPQPATYHGVLDGAELTLSVDVDPLDHVEGPFVLSRDEPGFLRKCQ